MTATEDRLKGLMVRGLRGEASAHRDLLSELAVLLRGYYGRRLGPAQADLEDLVQETLVAVHTRRMSYDPSQPLTPWVFAMARYKLIDHWRRSRRHQTRPIDEGMEVAADDTYEAASAALDLDRLMEALPPQQRRSIQAVKVEGLSVADVAARTGMSASNVKVSVHRGLKTLAGLVRRGDRNADR